MIVIESDNYGERTVSPTLRATQRAIRACGRDFRKTRLTLRDGRVEDEDHEIIGYEIED